MKFDPSPTIDAILGLFEDHGDRTIRWSSASETIDLLFPAVLTFLIVSVRTISNGDKFRAVMRALDAISGCFLDREEGAAEVPLGDLLAIMKAFQSAQEAAHGCIDYSSADEDAEWNILSRLVGCLIHLRDDSVHGGDLKDDFAADSLWLEPFVSLVKTNSVTNKKHLILGAKKHCKGLCGTLFSANKRWCGFQLLSLLASEGMEFHPEESSSQEDIKRRARMSSWKSRLEAEEAEELEEDFEVASRRLPRHLMDKVEELAEMDEQEHSNESEPDLVGRVLAWLICLDFLNGAAAVDIRNRSSISSYLDKTKAVGEVMLSALQYASLGDKNGGDWISCTNIENNANLMRLPALSTLTVFRTIESLPTLAKRWWTDDCPRPFQSPMNLFVGKRVAPETLKRELTRIKCTENLSGMDVSGSTVSREVVATYTQDEVSAMIPYQGI